VDQRSGSNWPAAYAVPGGLGTRCPRALPTAYPPRSETEPLAKAAHAGSHLIGLSTCRYHGYVAACALGVAKPLDITSRSLNNNNLNHGHSNRFPKDWLPSGRNERRGLHGDDRMTTPPRRRRLELEEVG